MGTNMPMNGMNVNGVPPMNMNNMKGMNLLQNQFGAMNFGSANNTPNQAVQGMINMNLANVNREEYEYMGYSPLPSPLPSVLQSALGSKYSPYSNSVHTKSRELESNTPSTIPKSRSVSQLSPLTRSESFPIDLSDLALDSVYGGVSALHSVGLGTQFAFPQPTATTPNSVNANNVPMAPSLFGSNTPNQSMQQQDQLQSTQVNGAQNSPHSSNSGGSGNAGSGAAGSGAGATEPNWNKRQRVCLYPLYALYLLYYNSICTV